MVSMSLDSVSLSQRGERGVDGQREDLVQPSPWTLKVDEAFIIPISGERADLQHVAKHLPTKEDKRDFMSTGLGSVMIIRYADSPVGPYDEILFIPGAFVSPAKAPYNIWSDRRIPRIFVSTEESLRNGRRNWGIRKELADFQFEYSKTESRSVRVKIHRRYGGECLLDASFSRTWRFLPLITCGVPDFLMPPIVERAIDEEGTPVAPEKWFRVFLQTCGMGGIARVDRIHESPGEHFPDLRKLGIREGTRCLAAGGTMVFKKPQICARL
uniref:Uncharacterized protein n=1 Tax=Chromera velia CCMP2878 TaxID=1169474 RepID=A0A0G4I153_9ALVE|eukprot:Cvel_43.t1-p1 / transcript=Cvel_43.t1 / gene=Cvel_43 / organism=Chromera_velia_CCMP2878 / gene_product=hypothetical protein / transcript_product=hypothetical protein / location=Cvel_scaffold5:257030-257836(+) / protein_length=269 / sequence_SO=supercontig / SO=protein_coding / is_pseudo=false